MGDQFTQNDYMKEKMGALEKGLDKMNTKLDEHVKDHEKAHQRVEEEIYRHGIKLEKHDTLIPELKDTMAKLGETVVGLSGAVSDFSIIITRLDEQTIANTNGRKTGKDWAMQIVIGILLLTIGHLSKGG